MTSLGDDNELLFVRVLYPALSILIVDTIWAMEQDPVSN